MHPIALAGWTLPVWLSDLLIVVTAIAVMFVAHLILSGIAKRIARHSDGPGAGILLSYARQPVRWIMVALALAFVRQLLHLDDHYDAVWEQVAGLLIPALIGWFAIALIRAGHRLLEVRTDISAADNLRARQKRTRGAILSRIAILVVGFITVSLMLLSIPSVRDVGVTLMASAGLAALAVGAAAQPALKNIIAGIQMAFTEPIRLDDVVIIDGEWGRIEEIRLTYVVVAIWDERRLVVPVSKFLDDSFQNWTRKTSKLLGSAFFYVDPTADVARLRAKFEEIVTADPHWDGRVQVMQVTDIKPEAMEVRVLASAKDAGTAFDLRCAIREAMMAFIRDEMPEALPRGRHEIGTAEWRDGGAVVKMGEEPDAE